jgi:hypothetical protein
MNIYSLEDQEKLVEEGVIDEYASAYMEGYLAEA